MRINLDEALELVWVHPPGTWENDAGPPDWYAVSTDAGIVAYCGTEKLARIVRRAIATAMTTGG